MDDGGFTWRRVLSKIPTVFGRLAYLAASRRNPDTGVDAHAALDQIMNARRSRPHPAPKTPSGFLRMAHLRLGGPEGRSGRIPGDGEAFLSVAQCRDLAPRSAREVERQLYLTDLETLMELRKAERSAFPMPET